MSLTRGQRIRAYLLIWAVVLGVPLAGGRLLHIAVAALGAAVLTVLFWWCTEVGAFAETADWHAIAKQAPRARGADPRASRLQRQVRDVLDDNRTMGADVLLAQSLAAIVDDRVRAHHGVDRETDPERFTAIVGPELAALVADVAAEQATIRPRQLPALISRIEQL